MKHQITGSARLRTKTAALDTNYFTGQSLKNSLQQLTDITKDNFGKIFGDANFYTDADTGNFLLKKIENYPELVQALKPYTYSIKKKKTVIGGFSRDGDQYINGNWKVGYNKHQISLSVDRYNYHNGYITLWLSHGLCLQGPVGGFINQGADALTLIDPAEVDEKLGHDYLLDNVRIGTDNNVITLWDAEGKKLGSLHGRDYMISDAEQGVFRELYDNQLQQWTLQDNGTRIPGEQVNLATRGTIYQAMIDHKRNFIAIRYRDTQYNYQVDILPIGSGSSILDQPVAINKHDTMLCFDESNDIIMENSYYNPTTYKLINSDLDNHEEAELQDTRISQEELFASLAKEGLDSQREIDEQVSRAATTIWTRDLLPVLEPLTGTNQQEIDDQIATLLADPRISDVSGLQTMLADQVSTERNHRLLTRVDERIDAIEELIASKPQLTLTVNQRCRNDIQVILDTLQQITAPVSIREQKIDLIIRELDSQSELLQQPLIEAVDQLIQTLRDRISQATQLSQLAEITTSLTYQQLTKQLDQLSLASSAEMLDSLDQLLATQRDQIETANQRKLHELRTRIQKLHEKLLLHRNTDTQTMQESEDFVALRNEILSLSDQDEREGLLRRLDSLLVEEDIQSRVEVQSYFLGKDIDMLFAQGLSAYDPKHYLGLYLDSLYDTFDERHSQQDLDHVIAYINDFVYDEKKTATSVSYAYNNISLSHDQELTAKQYTLQVLYKMRRILSNTDQMKKYGIGAEKATEQLPKIVQLIEYVYTMD